MLAANWIALTGPRHQHALLEVETLNAAEFKALIRGEAPKSTNAEAAAPSRKTQQSHRNLKGRYATDKRTDSGLDLSGHVPAADLAQIPHPTRNRVFAVKLSFL